MGAQDDDGVEAFHPVQGLTHGGAQIPPLAVILLHQVGDHLGVGLRAEGVPLSPQFFLQLDIVLHDAILDDYDLSLAIGVRMGVGLGDSTVGSPAGVAHADVSAERIRLQGTDQIGQFAHAAAQGNATILEHSYSSRIVTTVLQTLKALNDDRRRLSRAHVTDNSTHFSLLVVSL